MPKFIDPKKVEELSYTNIQLFKDVFDLLRPYVGRFSVVSGLRLMSDLVNLYPALAFASIVNILTKQPPVPIDQISWLVLGWGGAIAIRQITIYFAKVQGIRLGERIAIDAQTKSLHHLFRLDMAWQEKESSGNKLKRIQNAGNALNLLMRIWLNNAIEIAVNLIGMAIIVARFNLWVGGLMVLFMISHLAISRLMIKSAAIAAHQVNMQEEHVSGFAFELLSNVRTVKLMSFTTPLLEKFDTLMTELYLRIQKRIISFQNRYSILGVWGHIFRIGIAVFIIYGITKGRFEVGFLVLVNSYFGSIWESVAEASDVTQDFVVAKYSISRMRDILDEPVLIDADAGKSAYPQNWKEIKLNKVSFSYGDTQVLDEISFSISRGEKIGIVGLSGAGKSTLFKLLLKEYENFTGDISFDTLNIQQISKRDYFEHVTVVLQDTEVFNFSLRDNLTIGMYGDQNNDDVLHQAIEVSHVADFLHKLPEGLNTHIGEKGVKLSGGERQRLGLARAVYKKPEILLLDEATSHLDLESEEKIQDSLHHFFQSVTAVVIAHRLTTIKEMDKIIVIEQGRLVESGSFQELMTQQGRFFELWEKQKL